MNNKGSLQMPSGTPGAMMGSRQQYQNNVLYVTNFNRDMNSLFSPFGKLTDICVFTSYKIVVPYAFVEYDDLRDAVAAKNKLNNRLINGLLLRVDYKRTKPATKIYNTGRPYEEHQYSEYPRFSPSPQNQVNSRPINHHFDIGQQHRNMLRVQTQATGSQYKSGGLQNRVDSYGQNNKNIQFTPTFAYVKQDNDLKVPLKFQPPSIKQEEQPKITKPVEEQKIKNQKINQNNIQIVMKSNIGSHEQRKTKDREREGKKQKQRSSSSSSYSSSSSSSRSSRRSRRKHRERSNRSRNRQRQRQRQRDRDRRAEQREREYRPPVRNREQNYNHNIDQSLNKQSRNLNTVRNQMTISMPTQPNSWQLQCQITQLYRIIEILVNKVNQLQNKKDSKSLKQSLDWKVRQQHGRNGREDRWDRKPN